MSAVKRIKYCDALDFLENHLPKEFTFSEAKVSTGGRRILIYWKDEIQPMQDGKLRFFSEFGREYLGVSNTNEPHIEYIRKHLEKMYNALLKLKAVGKITEISFTVDVALSNINWKEKEKPNLWQQFS
ncbi:hypothetical protein B1J93_15215 [Leptospira kirschneri serovar Pomona]|uniref:Uncharacterized protein n=1 Tax=Leptospira kirschneri serovar Pomona TaxID=561005 RepID=A0A1T1DIT7_9LEPT|nr:hypothetical protein [Leptospira kirschneri]EKO58605.1 hypothetical protein LEP1GSC082_1973 [Leptospira kirschneri str. H2]EMJ92250.1 hypothetical protein LEP1GSC198_0727 [Leptospira kirschneri str. JB]EMK03288.1 hypothetical protein LEP1GSC166_0042 [Leptospira kirschneri]OOV40739.1 hypothetical protein B1J93_15215 [Leptospira kirschneri serovar Pomona]